MSDARYSFILHQHLWLYKYFLQTISTGMEILPFSLPMFWIFTQPSVVLLKEIGLELAPSSGRNLAVETVFPACM